jgi:hypothetical protein
VSIFSFHNPEAEQTVQRWQLLLRELPDDGTADEWKSAIIDFLIPDKINYNEFMLNWKVVFHETITDGCTPSVTKFQFACIRPKGYPNWFLAGYPDVAGWFSGVGMSVDEDEKFQQRIVQILSLESEADLVEGDPPYIKPKHLRTIIQAYQQQTKRKLECACTIAKLFGL